MTHGNSVVSALPSVPRKPFYRALYFPLVAAITIGVLMGHFFPSLAVQMKPLGDAFIKLIRMVIGPVIFCTVVGGIAGMGDIKKVGRVGGKALLYFEVISTISLVVGLIAGHVFHPGTGFNLNPATLDVSSLTAYTTTAHQQTVAAFLLNLIPNTFTSAFDTGNVLQILLISTLFGTALSAVGERARPLIDLINGLTKVLFGMVHIITKFAAIGAFGAIAFTIGTFGISAVLPLIKLIGAFYATLFIFVVVVLGGIARLIGLRITSFISYIKEEILIVLATSSSEAALPQLLEKLERLGCSKSVVGLVIPAGYSFNLDGTNIYLTIAVLFIAQAFNVELTLTQQLTLVVVAMLTSKGASGVAGAAFIMLTSTLMVFPLIPVSGMVLILGIHRFMGTGLAVVNTIGNGVATLVISVWEGEFNRSQFSTEMNRTR
jgi:aerobic C4-dicarboxylate transport protein